MLHAELGRGNAMRSMIANRCLWMMLGLALGQLLAMPAAVVRADEPAEGKRVSLDAATVEMVAPAEWKEVEKKSRILDYEFELRGPEDQVARVTMMLSGGSLQANIDRWVDQFEGAKADAAQIEKRDIGGREVHFVQLSGTFKESMGGGPFAPGRVVSRPNYRMLGVIIAGRQQNAIFIKITGPDALVQKMVEPTQRMVESMQVK
jgi:hypothetical protein